MNLILFNEQQILNANTFLLSERQKIHISQVIQPKIGDTLNVGLINGFWGPCHLKSFEGHNIELDLNLKWSPPLPLPVTLYVALPRPKHFSRILENITSLGVKNIHFYHSYRVDKNYWKSDLINLQRQSQALYLGLEQAKDTLLPKVFFHRWFRPFVEDHLGKLNTKDAKWLAHPYAQRTLDENPLLNNSYSQHHVVVGPEGGFIDFEIDLLQNNGFQLFKLSHRVFKLETALTAILAQFFKFS